jgi:NitT/TauT family transport system permease protein
MLKSKNFLQGVLSPVLLILLLLVFWELSTQWFSIPKFILPSPIEITQNLGERFGIYLPHILDTLIPILAVLLDVSQVLRNTLYPIILALQTTPKIAIAPLLIVWFGIGLTPKVIIVALLALFPVLINVVAGLESADRGLVTLGRSVNASQGQIYRTVKIPSSIPYLFAGLKLAMTNSVIGAIVGEWMASDRGLGYLLVYYNATLDTTALFAVLIILVVLAGLLFATIGIAERLLSWDARQRRQLSSTTSGSTRAAGSGV